MADSAREFYQCPGESYPISRAVHLGRLARFYAACRDCPHRHDTGTLSARQVRHLRETEQRVDRGDWQTAEGLAGVAVNEINPARVRSLAAAHGAYLQRTASDRSQAPEVVLAHDGRWLAVELVPAASEGLRWSGCRVVDLGAATSAIVALGASQFNAAGALLIGNPMGLPHTVGVKLWGPQARPLSSGGGLDAVRAIESTGIDRPVRRFGGLSRADFATDYLGALRPYYHALRPLRVVLDSASVVVTRALELLTEPVACEFIPAKRAAGWRGARSPARSASRSSLATQVVAERAHFGIWIDGDGESMYLVDELGRTVPVAELVRAISLGLRHILPVGRVVLDEHAAADVPVQFARHDIEVIRAHGTREGMDSAMREHHASLGGDSAGRIWFADSPGAGDALRALTMLFVVMSQGDRSLSELVGGPLAAIGIGR